MQRAAVTTMLSRSACLVSGLLFVTLGGQASAQDPATINPLPAIPIEARPVTNPSPTPQGSDAESQGEYARRPDASHRTRVELDESVQRTVTDVGEILRSEPPSSSDSAVPPPDDPAKRPAKGQDGETEHTQRPKDDDAVGSRKDCIKAGHTEHPKKKPTGHSAARAGCVHPSKT